MQRNSSNSLWNYRRLTHPVGIEVSDWVGNRSPSLSAHLHDEAQISIVYSGVRSFQIGATIIRVTAGSFVVIPAGTPHLSVGMAGVETHSQDFFVRPEFTPQLDPSEVYLGDIRCQQGLEEETVVEALVELIALRKISSRLLSLGTSLPTDIVEAVQTSNLSIAEIATEAGFSREGFIRKFARELGMTPYAYRIAHNATLARSLLRCSIAPAAAALEAGFADQSHLGRVFRKNFGTTPAAFARAWTA